MKMVVNSLGLAQNFLNNIQSVTPKGKMSEWLKLLQCKHTPTELFTIFDYTKIAYVTDSYLCLREIVSPQQKPNFIQIKHSFDQIISMHSAHNNIITVQRKQQNYFICFYGIVVQEECYKILWSIQGSQLKIRTLYNDNQLILCCSNSQKNHQLVFFDCSDKCIVSKGFIQGQVQYVSVGPNNSLSVQFHKQIIAYKNQPRLDNAAAPSRIYKQAEVNLSITAQKHVWIQDQLLIWSKNKAFVIIKNKICQQFNQFHRLHCIVPIVCGFLAFDGCVIKVFKKKDIQYELSCELVDQRSMECKRIILSPQQDILAYFSPINNDIIYSNCFGRQIQQIQSSESNSNSQNYLKVGQINHAKAYDYTVYSSCQAWFAAVNGYEIQLINSYNYKQFLKIQLQDQDQTSFVNSDLKIRHLAIHPNRPIFAVALKKVVRIYYITFNQCRLLKQINISMGGYILFNHSGSLMTVVVSGKGGAKIYIFKINQFNGQYSLIDNLTVAKKPISLAWDSLDSKLFCFFNQGYYQWTVQSKFKNRKEIILNLKFKVAGALIGKQDTILFWGPNNIVSVVNDQIIEQNNLKSICLKQIFVEGQNYYFTFEDGKIGRYKTLDPEASLIKAFDLKTNGKKYEVQIQEGRKFIYISSELNLKYYEFGSGLNIFNDVIGIQKKKLYNIMQKHKIYEMEIKKVKQQFANVILQIKNNTILEQKKKQQQYKKQLKDHVERQKRVKQQKSKLEQMIQQNLQAKQREAMNQIKQLQRLYQRKIALTTNKLLTEKQIGFRQKTTSQNKLKILQQKHYQSIQEIRKQFAQHLRSNILDKNEAQRQFNQLKKQYQARLYQLEQENQILLKGLQQKNESSIIGLRKLVNNWENKYSQCISMKDNIERQLREQQLSNSLLKQKISYIQVRKVQSERRCQHLSKQITKIEKVLQERNRKLQFYQKRIQDLQKSNQILKYRVLEVKQQNDPYEEEISKLKTNLTDLQQQYDKVLKSSHQQQQKMLIIKKQKSKLKQDYEVINQKYKKLSKRHQQLLDKIRETTKSPIQQIRKQLLAIVDSYVKIQKSYSVLNKRSDSPLGELNRIRDHLQVCLDEAITSSKKNDEQRKIEIVKKSHQNSQLIIQINTLRKKIRALEDQIKQKNVQIGRLIRGQVPPSLAVKQQKISTTQAQTKDFTKTKSRQTFFEKSLFKSGAHWNARKRLKTQQGQRRKKSSHSMMKQRNPNGSLYIHTQSQQVQQYKRIIEQKDLFIQKLIAKIQKNS